MPDVVDLEFSQAMASVLVDRGGRGREGRTFAVVPTLGTGLSVALDSLHTTIMTFADVVPVANGSGYVTKLVIHDRDDLGYAGNLWLFSQSVTGTTAQDPLSLTDGDMDLCVGVIPWGPYYDGTLNRVSVNDTVRLPFRCTNSGTSLYGILQTLGVPTHTASGLRVVLTVVAD